MKKTVAVFLDGRYDLRNREFYQRHIQTSSYLVAADGGVTFLNSIGVVPDLLVGDGDSADFKKCRAKEKKQFPTDKDFTDGELALKEAESIKPERINVYGALTKAQEADHFYGNLGLLYQSAQRNGPKVVIRDVRQDIYVASRHTGTIKIVGESNDIVSLSVFGSERASEVNTRGLVWEINDGNIPFGVGQFLRNRLVGSNATITVGSGTLLIFHYKKGDLLSYPI